jgi:hypothetical protein
MIYSVGVRPILRTVEPTKAIYPKSTDNENENKNEVDHGTLEGERERDG